MENTFEDTQPYAVSDLKHSISPKSTDTTALEPLTSSPSVPQKRTYTSDCLASLLNVSSIPPNDNHNNSDNGHANNNDNNQDHSSPLLSTTFGVSNTGMSSPYESDHSYDPYTSDSWSSQPEQPEQQHDDEFLSDLFDNDKGDKYGSAADPIHYISTVPRHSVSRRRSNAPIDNQEQQQSPFTSSLTMSDDSDSDSFGNMNSPSFPPRLPPRPLNFMQRYRQQQQQDNSNVKSVVPSDDDGKKSFGIWSDGNENELDEHTLHDKTLICDEDEFDAFGDNEDDWPDTPQLPVDDQPENDTLRLSPTCDQQSIQHHHSNDILHKDHLVLDSQQETCYVLDDLYGTTTQDAGNDDMTSTIQLQHSHSQDMYSVSCLGAAKSFSSSDDEGKLDASSDLNTIDQTSTKAPSQDSTQTSTKAPSQDSTHSTKSSLDYLRVEKNKQRLTQSSKDEQHWLVNPTNLPSSPKKIITSPQTDKVSQEPFKPRRRLPGLSRPKDSTCLVSSASAPSIATMLTLEQHNNDNSLRPTNVIVKSSSTLALAPRRKKTLGMSRRHIY
ncbi:hypothetical protein BC941DRAFT_457495 [Chlamydoabsidia padenii]|nr:hypothetical protein BC941DRAFT_457495 [Chlamydoabsidia padenii]